MWLFYMYVQYMWYSMYNCMYVYYDLSNTCTCECICMSVSLEIELFLSTYSCMYVYNCSICTCGLSVPTSCVMHCWLSGLYRTGLIKDLLLCSGYRDSSSLRPS